MKKDRKAVEETPGARGRGGVLSSLGGRLARRGCRAGRGAKGGNHNESRSSTRSCSYEGTPPGPAAPHRVPRRLCASPNTVLC